MTRRLVLPVGDITMLGIYKSDTLTPRYKYTPTEGYKHLAASEPWWVDEDLISELIGVAYPYTSSGFKLCCGDREGVTEGDTKPGVILYDHQERGGRMGHYGQSSRMEKAVVGDVLVWLEIEDTEKAYKVLMERSDIPCAVVCDMHKYSFDDRYKQVFDIADRYFIHFYQFKRPLTLKHTDIISIADMYGV